MVKNILLLGITMRDNNKGVDALGIGTVEMLKINYGINRCKVFYMANKTEIYSKNIGGFICEIYTFKFMQYIQAIISIFLKNIRLQLFQNKLTKIIDEIDIAFNINKGDSFTDNYGVKLWLKTILDSFLLIYSHKKLIFLPQTIGPFNNILLRLFSVKLLSKVNDVYVRDNMASDILEKFSIEHKKWYDMSFYMKACRVDLPININKKVIGINLSGLIYYSQINAVVGKQNIYIKFHEELIENLIKQNYEILFIPHTYDVNRNDNDDLKAIKDFLKLIGNGHQFIDKNYEADQLKYIISKCYFFIGARMHACLAAITTNTPVVGISYSYKFKGTFSNFNIEKMVIELNQLDNNNIGIQIDKILEFINNRENIINTLNLVNQKISNLHLHYD